MVRMVAKSARELNEAPKVISIAPKPTADRIISPVTMPRTARPIPRRIPAMIIGRAAGKITFKKSSLSRAPKARAISVKVGIDVADARSRVHRDDDEGEEKNDPDAGMKPEAKSDHQKRNE